MGEPTLADMGEVLMLLERAQRHCRECDRGTAGTPSALFGQIEWHLMTPISIAESWTKDPKRFGGEP